MTGSVGQIGSELTLRLRQKHGKENVVAGYNSKAPTGTLEDGPKEQVDIRSRDQLEQVIKKYNLTTIYHLASILSAASEKDNELAWQANLEGLRSVLEMAKKYSLKVFWPS